MHVADPQDERDVHRLIARFANSFDAKAWGDLTACLAESVYTDYSDLRGTPPETMTRERFVELRRQALEPLQTHHLAGNVELDIGDGEGSVRASMVIYRRRPDGSILNTHCLYLFHVRKGAGRWRIDSIAQKVLWSDGDPAIHAGIAKPPA
jgi:ketosteroid isomerase-like protein